MKPPLCAVCRVRFGPTEGGLVYFQRTASDEAWHRKRERTPGFVGHPPEAAWFCSAHVTAARAHQNETLSEALGAIRKEFPPAT